MLKKISLAAAMAVLVCGAAAAADGGRDPLAGSPVYSDPVFQDYVETAGGYLNPSRALKPSPAFRDAVAPSCAGARVLVSVTPGTRDMRRLLRDLGAAGFNFTGERTTRSRRGMRTRLLGWAGPSALEAIRKVPGVAAVRAGLRPAAKGAR